MSIQIISINLCIINSLSYWYALHVRAYFKYHIIAQMEIVK